MQIDVNTLPFRLCDLPAELQLRIFELAVASEKKIRLTSRRLERGKGHQPALSRVCRKIRFDVLKLFYSMNTFGYNTHNFAMHVQDKEVKYMLCKSETRKINKWVGNMGAWRQYINVLHIDLDHPSFEPLNMPIAKTTVQLGRYPDCNMIVRVVKELSPDEVD